MVESLRLWRRLPKRLKGSTGVCRGTAAYSPIDSDKAKKNISFLEHTATVHSESEITSELQGTSQITVKNICINKQVLGMCSLFMHQKLPSLKISPEMTSSYLLSIPIDVCVACHKPDKRLNRLTLWMNTPTERERCVQHMPMP